MSTNNKHDMKSKKVGGQAKSYKLHSLYIDKVTHKVIPNHSSHFYKYNKPREGSKKTIYYIL